MSTVIIQGSARNDGETNELSLKIIGATSWDFYNLNNFEIGQYDYLHDNRFDDFLPLMKKLISLYDTYLFITPVYWYSMSGTMKVFFDRLTDLITIEKEWGRKLRGKNMAVITSSYGANLGEQFWIPFSETAKYLGMHFLGGHHTIAEKVDQEALKNFLKIVGGKPSA